MSRLENGTFVTDLTAEGHNRYLTENGYTIRCIETWHGHDDQSVIHWDAPHFDEAELPY